MFRDSHTILVVDPDERSYKTFESVLGSSNNVWFVPNGKTAVELPDSQKIDVIFVSQALNGIDGNIIVESFKRRFPSIPVVILAENPTAEEVLSAFRCGARELIIKPLDEGELIAITKKIFGFASKKRSKRWWFLPDKKDTQKNNVEKNGPRHLEKIFKKSSQIESSVVAEVDKFQMKENLFLTEDSSTQLIINAYSESGRPEKMTHSFEPIKNSCPHIQAFFLGSFRVFVNSQPIENWPGKKGKSIFAYLLLNHNKKIFRDVLMDIFWQKSSPDSARNCLNVSIHGLRNILEEIDPKSEFILFQDECYYFNPGVDIGLDIEEFRKTWRHAQSLENNKGLSVAIPEFERAAGLYKGDFLEDEIYDSWSSLDRENLREIYLVILERLSKFYVEGGQISTAIGLCEKIIQKDNCREEIHRRLMRCHYYSGHRFKAIRQFKKCKEILRKELEVDPDNKTLKLYEHIKRGSLS
jgi:DNA-binding SARP family transcriptional activator/DNA-binding NarL/FixJ family response regulator